MIDLDHLSYSSINYWLTCGQAFQYKYLQGQSEPRSPSLVFGSCIHAAIASYLRDGIVLLDGWQEAWDREAAQDDIVWNGEKPTELFNYGVKMLSSQDIQETISSLTPTTIQGEKAIEQEIELHVPGVDIPVIGYIDLIQEPFVPTELKTSGKSWNQEQADKELQATFYVAALNQAGLLPLPCIMRYVVLVKLKTPKVQVIETERTFEDVLRLFNLVRQVYSAMENRIFIANPVSWKCSPKYCGHWEGCRGGIGGIR